MFEISKKIVDSKQSAKVVEYIDKFSVRVQKHPQFIVLNSIYHRMLLDVVRKIKNRK